MTPVRAPSVGAPVRCQHQPARRRRRDPRDDGVATVLVVALCAVLVLVGAGTASLAAVAVARHRAASAADLSALAAAVAVLDGPAAACGRAHRLAVRVGARIASCSVDGDVVQLVAQVRPAGPLGRWGTASARARAGPVPPDG